MNWPQAIYLAGLKPGDTVSLDRLVAGDTVLATVIEKVGGEIQVSYEHYGTVTETVSSSTGYNERYTAKILSPEDLERRAEVAARPKPNPSGEGPRLRMIQVRKK